MTDAAIEPGILALDTCLFSRPWSTGALVTSRESFHHGTTCTFLPVA